MIDPNGVTTTSSVKVTNKGKNTFYVEYLPTVVGNYTIEIKFAGQHIPKSPYTVRISYRKTFIFLMLGKAILGCVLFKRKKAAEI